MTFEPYDSWDTSTKVAQTHRARSVAERQAEDPTATTGDTEWFICNIYGISSEEFHNWNQMSPNDSIEIGREYIVGWEDKSNTSDGTSNQSNNDWIYEPDRGTPSNNRFNPYDLFPSQKLINYIKSWERPSDGKGEFTTQIFRDTNGHRTIGYGHYINDAEYPQWTEYDPEIGGTKQLSPQEIEALFKKDIEERGSIFVQKYITTYLSQGEFDALTDLVFHRGHRSLIDSGLKGYLNSVPDGNFDPQTITDCFMIYAEWENAQTGQMEPNAGFLKRRNEELDMFFHDKYTLHS